jgi:hypothetical protein
LVLGPGFVDFPFAVVAVTESDKGIMVILRNTVFLKTSVSEIVFVKVREVRVGAKDPVNVFFFGDSYKVPEARITVANDRSGVPVLITEVTGEA